MIIKLETLLENGIIDPNKITELVCDGKTVYKGYSDDIASFGKDYEFIKFNNTVNESFNTPAYTIEVKAKNPVNESFTSQFGLKTKADVIKSMKYFDYYDEDKKDALLEEIDYLCDLYNIDEGFDFVLDDELNNYVDIDILTEKLTRYNVDRKLDNMAAKTARKNFTPVYAAAGTFMGWFFAGIIGGVIGHFIGISIGKNNHRARITELYNFMKNDSQCIQITNHIKQILKNDKLDKEDKTQLKELRKQFANRIKELRGQYNWSANSVKKALAESTEVLSENKQQVLKDISKNGKSDYKTSQKVKDEKSGVMVSIHQVPNKSYEDNNSKFHKKVQGIVNGMEKRNGKDFDENERTAVYDRVTKEVKDDYERQAYNKEEQEAKNLNGFKNRANYQKKQLKKLNK